MKESQRSEETSQNREGANAVKGQTKRGVVQRERGTWLLTSEVPRTSALYSAAINAVKTNFVSGHPNPGALTNPQSF
jgi:hypothetical protein